MTFGDLDDRIIGFPEFVQIRPFQRILVYMTASVLFYRSQYDDLRKELNISRAQLQAISDLDEAEKARLEEWVQMSVPEESA